MITCPKCSAQNDPSNRFCDQCGFRLDGAPDSSAAAAPTVAAPVALAADAPAPALAMNCPSCGAAVLPGEAFCDVCGAALQPVAAAPALENDLPTVLAPPAGGIDAISETATNPNDVATAATPTIAPPPPPEPSAAPPSTPAPASAPSESDYDAEKQRLEEAVATQDKLIAQMEQLQTTFGAATPPAILDGLKQAREAKAKAESDLQALPPPKPPVDPAEVARLEEQIATQGKLIAQMEQLQSTFGAATPPAILDGLKQAQETKAKAESELQALTSSATPAPLPSQVPTSTDIAPVPVPSTPPPSAAVTPPPSAAVPSTVAPAPIGPASDEDTLPPPALAPVVPAPTPAPVPVPLGPRLVFADGGKDVPLPLDKAEIIVGREDPISQIFPEIDLTPFGGETGGVSRQHARITQNNGQWLLTDLNSTNYTRIDGVKIDPQVPVTMRDGARVQFGRIAAVFHV